MYTVGYNHRMYLVKRRLTEVEKEVVLETYLYVSVKDKDLDQPSEEMIKEAKEKMIKALDKAGIDYQIFSGELRD